MPYHRPKQRCLEDFLSRKGDTPEVISSIKVQSIGGGDKCMSEREKLLEDFYASEAAGDNDADDESEEGGEEDGEMNDKDGPSQDEKDNQEKGTESKGT